MTMRQRCDRKSGFWFQLREEVEKGILQGTESNKGKRTESKMAGVLRLP